MSAYKLRYFCNPQILRTIRSQDLFKFLRRFKQFFEQHKITIPTAKNSAEFDFDALIVVLSNPTIEAPVELLEALYIIDSVSHEKPFDELQIIIEREQLILVDSNDQTPIDIVLQVWLLNPKWVFEAHILFCITKPKAFSYYHSIRESPPVFRMPSEPQLKKFIAEMRLWFANRKRGRVFKPLILDSDDDVRFSFVHGDTSKRVETDEDTADRAFEDDPKTGTIFFRPLRTDVAVFEKKSGELRINAQLAGEKRKYCEMIGKYFFGDSDCFPAAYKYSLEPLIELGEDSLSCGDIEGIESIHLTEIKCSQDAGVNFKKILKSNNCFEALKIARHIITPDDRLVEATFKIKFESCSTARTVTILPNNVARYTRDADSYLIEMWMLLRGFIANQTQPTPERRRASHV